jgi:hypothetical protein
MSRLAALPDPINAAIAAEERVEMIQVQIKLAPNGRPALLAVPKDVSDFELLALFGQILVIGDQLRAQRPASRIIVAGRVS